MAAVSLTDRASQAVENLDAIKNWLRVVERGADSRWPLSNKPAFHAAAMALESVRLAEPFWWERDFCNAVFAAAPTLPTWTIRPELVPVPSGFFSFPIPFRIPHRPSGGWDLSALSWAMTKYDRIIVQAWLRGSDGLRPAYSVFAKIGDDVAALTADAVNHPDLALEVGPADSAPAFPLLTLFGTCLLFLEQRLALATTTPLDRIARRHFEEPDVEYPALRIIRLRTIKRPSSLNDAEAVDWQYRWIVRGHWRQQWHASDGSHRPQWIAPYIKGPDDKPVKAPKASVFAVVR